MREGQLRELSESEGQKLLFLILPHMLSSWVAIMGAVYSFLPRNFLMFSQCNKASQYAANIVRMGSERPLRKLSYQVRPWKY